MFDVRSHWFSFDTFSLARRRVESELDFNMAAHSKKDGENFFFNRICVYSYSVYILYCGLQRNGVCVYTCMGYIIIMC